MENFDFSSLFGYNSNNFNNKRKRQKSRTCRIEELEDREILSATPWLLVDAFDVYSETTQNEPQVEWYSTQLSDNPEVALRSTSGSFNDSPAPPLAPLAAGEPIVDQVQAKYADLDLTGIDNIIEIAAGGLSDSALRTAIATTSTNGKDNLIVVHTTAAQNKIMLSGTELSITGSKVTIVSLGDTNLTIDANERSRVLNIEAGTTVSLAGLTLTKGQRTGNGGGIFNYGGTLTLTDCTISGNKAIGDGGGIQSENGGTVTATNCVISGNSAYNGGGVGTDGFAVLLTFTNCTIAGNTADNVGGGIYAAEYTLNNSIVAKNTAVVAGGNDINATPVSCSNNFIGDGSGSGLTNGVDGNIVGTTVSPFNPHFISFVALDPWQSWNLHLEDGTPAAELKMGVTSLGYVPLGYNTHDWNRVETAKKVNGFPTVGCVTWTKIGSEFRLTQVDKEGIFLKLTGSLDLSGCTALASLHCQSNQLTELNVSGCEALGTLWCYGNQLTFSSLKLPSPSPTTFNAANQALVPVAASVASDKPLDLASVGATGYTWYYAIDDSEVPSALYKKDGNKFTFIGLDPGTEIYCKMTNMPGYPGMVLATTEIIIATPLTTPTFGTVIAISDSEILVTWSSVPNADGFLVEYATTASFSGAETVTTTNTWVLLDDLDANQTYYIRVTALGVGLYSDSEESTAEPIKMGSADPVKTPLTDPVITVTSGGSSSINVKWDTVPNASGYQIEWSKYAAFGLFMSTATNATEIIIPDLETNTTYYVRVKALGSENYNDSGWSNIPSAMTDKIPLTVPRFGDLTATHDSIRVEWGAVANAGGYRVQWATDSIFTQIVSTVDLTTTSFVIENLDMDTTYYIHVRALGTVDYNDSMWSEGTPVQTTAIRLPVVSLIVVPKGTGYAAVKGAKTDAKVATVDAVTFAWAPNTKHTATDQFVIEVWTPKKGKTPAKLVVTVSMTIGMDGNVSDYVVAGLKQSDVVIKREEIAKKVSNLGYKYNVTVMGLKAGTKYSLQMQASLQGTSLSKMLKISASTKKFAAVSKVKAALSGESVALDWKTPSKPANGAVYEKYEIDWVVSAIERKSVVLETSSNTGATVLLSTLTNLGIDLTSTKKHNFVVRAVIYVEDGVTVVNQSLEAKFSIVPSKLRA